MAAFTNQFSQQSPFDLPFRPEFFGWPSQIADEAIALLSNRDISWLTAVAVQLEQIISKAAAAPREETIRGVQALAASFLAVPILCPGYFRDLFGDFNLLIEGLDAHPWESDGLPSTKTDHFIVFCLWKLVDANALLSTATKNEDATHRGGAYVIEAMRALQAAQSIYQDEQLTSDQNRRNGILANRLAEANRRRALEMAE